MEDPASSVNGVLTSGNAWTLSLFIATIEGKPVWPICLVSAWTFFKRLPSHYIYIYKHIFHNLRKYDESMHDTRPLRQIDAPVQCATAGAVATQG